MSAGGAAVLALAGAWLTGEVVLQAWQWHRGRGGGRSEWASLVVLVLVGFACGPAAGPFQGFLVLPRPVALWVGLAIALVGITFRFASIIVLGRFFRGVVTIQADHEVVRRGPYRVIRHPSYLGALVGVLGFGLTGGSVAAALVMTAVVGIGLGYRIAVEERALRAGLGAAYEQYAATTGRLLPRFRRPVAPSPTGTGRSDSSKPAAPVVGNPDRP
ncbi:isoprenylcysteine carboxylmethyltransferase family protein [Actinomycetospora endophytica]|uniref:Isoprenylcysteine carboxylmethyltransferase family protein n=1 Tax=Actinomycetospora endophytica TaxID=2291215 RepID=A0ABS8PA92_9PSEU|nr:isoprenylcysteine carboxylmethyltransferase family protein [Actinomycetospora endophytica]MCD2194842.1 isoprenylcysteine carboxylmethyltransferase family protein [Actinomycetospora endophytica]